MEYVNVSVQVKIGKGLVAWALKAYRKHQKVYAKDVHGTGWVRRELADLWITQGGPQGTFEDTEATIGLVEFRGKFRLDDVHWDSDKQKWRGFGVVHAVWKDPDESTKVPIWVEIP